MIAKDNPKEIGKNVLVIGLGYVGLTFAIHCCDKGYNVYGIEVNQDILDSLALNKAHFLEPGIDDLIVKYKEKSFFFLDTVPENIEFDYVIISVGTPYNKTNAYVDLRSMEAALSSTANVITDKTLVVLRSTVSVTTSRSFVYEKLKTFGVTSPKIAFCPERTAEGRALEELRNLPQIVGGFDSKSRELGLRLFGENTHTVIDIGSLEAAEMCKLMDNAYRDTRFAFANQMAELSEKYGLNINHLINKINLSYERNTIPYPSPGVGGACLSKDPYILISNFEDNKLESPLIKASRRVNEKAPEDMFNKTDIFLKSVGKNIKNTKIFIVGIAFKGNPETSDTRESTTLWFIEYLISKGVKNLWGYDPIIDNSELNNLGLKACSLEEGFKNSDAVFFLNNHRSFYTLDIEPLLSLMNDSSYFFDGWNIFNISDVVSHPGITYSGIGLK